MRNRNWLAAVLVATGALAGCAVTVTGSPSAADPAATAGPCQQYVTGSEVQQDLGAPVARIVADGGACQFWLGRPAASYLTSGPLTGAYLQVDVEEFGAGDADELAAWMDTYARGSDRGEPVTGLGDGSYFEETAQEHRADSPGGMLIVRSGSVLASVAFNPELSGDQVVTGDLRARLAAVAERVIARA